MRDTACRGTRDACCCIHLRVTLREPTTRAVYTQRTVIYGVVIVNRNLERTNQNDGFKITALQISCWLAPYQLAPLLTVVKECQ